MAVAAEGRQQLHLQISLVVAGQQQQLHLFGAGGGRARPSADKVTSFLSIWPTNLSLPRQMRSCILLKSNPSLNPSPT